MQWHAPCSSCGIKNSSWAQHPPACTKAAPWSAAALSTSLHVLTALALWAHCAHTCRRCRRCRVACRCCSSCRLLQRSSRGRGRERGGPAGGRLAAADWRSRRQQQQAGRGAEPLVPTAGQSGRLETLCAAAQQTQGSTAACAALHSPLLVAQGRQPVCQLLQPRVCLLHHILQHIAERHELQARDELPFRHGGQPAAAQRLQALFHCMPTDQCRLRRADGLY